MNLMSRRRGRVGWRRHPAKVLYGATCIVGSNPTVSEFKKLTERWVFYFVYIVTWLAIIIWKSILVGQYRLTCSLRKCVRWMYRNTHFDYYRQFDYFRHNALLVRLFEVGSCWFLKKSNCAKCSCAVRKCFKNFLVITECNT